MSPCCPLIETFVETFSLVSAVPLPFVKLSPHYYLWSLASAKLQHYYLFGDPASHKHGIIFYLKAMQDINSIII